MHIFKDFSKELVQLIKQGAVGIIPTDTVYGLACCANNQAAVSRLYGLKKRENKPGTVIAADIDQLVELGLVRRYLKAVEEFWPGPISVLIPLPENLHYLNFSMATLAVRIPADKALSALLKQTGPLLTSSANSPGEQTATNLSEARAYFSDAVDFYLDGGSLNNPPSAIIQIIDDAVSVVRAGYQFK